MDLIDTSKIEPSGRNGKQQQIKGKLQLLLSMADLKGELETKSGSVGGGNKYLEKVVDDLVSLNGLFTVAVFMGLSFATPGTVHSLEGRPECDPDIQMRKRVVQFEIASFSCFLFSGFLAKTVKIFFYIYQMHSGEEVSDKGRKDIRVLGAFYLSIYGTITGCVCLLLAMVDVVQIKLGKLSCNSDYTLRTVIVMCIFIGTGVGTYFTAVTYGAKMEFDKWRKGNTAEKAEELMANNGQI